jgi:hypothetical protein
LRRELLEVDVMIANHRAVARLRGH